MSIKHEFSYAALSLMWRGDEGQHDDHHIRVRFHNGITSISFSHLTAGSVANVSAKITLPIVGGKSPSIVLVVPHGTDEKHLPKKEQVVTGAISVCDFVKTFLNEYKGSKNRVTEVCNALVEKRKLIEGDTPPLKLEEFIHFNEELKVETKGWIVKKALPLLTSEQVQEEGTPCILNELEFTEFPLTSFAEMKNKMSTLTGVKTSEFKEFFFAPYGTLRHTEERSALFKNLSPQLAHTFYPAMIQNAKIVQLDKHGMVLSPLAKGNPEENIELVRVIGLEADLRRLFNELNETEGKYYIPLKIPILDTKRHAYVYVLSPVVTEFYTREGERAPFFRDLHAEYIRQTQVSGFNEFEHDQLKKALGNALETLGSDANAQAPYRVALGRKGSSFEKGIIPQLSIIEEWGNKKQVSHLNLAHATLNSDHPTTWYRRNP